MNSELATQGLQRKAASIRLVIFDVDGVLTDGRLLFGSDGSEFKTFHVRDGHGIKMLQSNDIDVAIISGRSTPAVERRMAELAVKHVYLGAQDKTAALEDLLARTNVSAEQAAYVGDDVVDIPVMRRVGLAIAVQDADPYVKRHAHWLTPSNGGRGAARDVSEFLLEARGRLDAARTQLF
jgi:3-deoxy-D-manno-octulosonate 8-phosphate phosphatase (KDO 8-P phosphatase)